MKNRVPLPNLLIISSLLISSLALPGCGSTPDDEAEPECRTESAENCAGDDRGYDPCLVNKNLPVCKD